MKVSLPVLEVTLVLGLFFAVPVASVTIDLFSMGQSRGHRHLSWRSMIDSISKRPQRDLLRSEHAARIRREVFEAIDSFQLPETEAFVTTDPHDKESAMTDPHSVPDGH